MSASLLSGVKRTWDRMTARPITFVGHSHLWAMTDAITEAGPAARLVDFWKHSDPFAQNELSKLDEILPSPVRGPVVSLIGGSRYNILTLYRHPKPFDFILPDDPNPPEAGAEIIPLEAIGVCLAERMAANQALMAAVRERVSGRMYHLDFPAPWGEERNPADYQNDPWMHPTDAFGPRRLRLKMAKLESQLMREFCAAHDIVVIPPPPQTTDNDGFLRPEFFGDLMHANAAYGRLALAHVRAVVR